MFNGTVDHIIKKRRKEIDNGSPVNFNLLDLLLISNSSHDFQNVEDDEPPMNDDEIKGILAEVLAASVETTLSVVSANLRVLEGDEIIGDHYWPSGTWFWIDNERIMNHPNNWNEFEYFNPDRFLCKELGGTGEKNTEEYVYTIWWRYKNVSWSEFSTHRNKNVDNFTLQKV
ncbi:cytochrome P450 [Gigaspora margarita]|uniref:Cytochrome P450 n=1 Tax=Gigaspora margarita TaxID=4874 RepID=A0A8H3XDC1_GIGMA|nr:cytochrome P450 [Gigaspora margarita]